jgi:hypothetical protein
MSDDKALEREQIEQCLKDLDCARTDDDQHVIMISHNSRTQMLAIRFINTEPMLANNLFRISLAETQQDPYMQSQNLGKLH